MSEHKIPDSSAEPCVALAPTDPSRRRFPIGAECNREGTHFRVWAPEAATVRVALESGGEHALAAEPEGYFSGQFAVRAGQRYRFRLDEADELLPDPASRWQPEGPFGWSEVVSPDFAWTDDHWRGIALPDAVLYETHIGTFTPEGTWNAAAKQLPELASAGINVLEVLPVAEFPGAFGWGYDGVNFFAPHRYYGTPEEFRQFVNRAHSLGVGVILDVVYNHFGPAGNYIPRFSRTYFNPEEANDWGDAINFDGEGSAGVREFVLANAAYWVKEFHLDGLRLDATQAIIDSSEPHILQEIVDTVRQSAGGRDTIVIAENEPQKSQLVRPSAGGGYGLDGVWNDDFHHSAVVALIGRNEAYYADHRGVAQEFLSAVKHGFLFQGQRYSWQKKPRGTPSLDIPRSAFVLFLENHDQLANSARGVRIRLLTSAGRWRAMTTLLLLGPNTPMLFQGQEFGAEAPFLYFADHEEDLRAKVAEGRIEFLSQFRSIDALNGERDLAPPHAVETFERCKLDFTDRQRHRDVYALHKDLLRIRKQDGVLRRGQLDGFVLGEHAFVLRFFGEAGDDRILVVNFGLDLQPPSIPDPLIAPPAGRSWRMRFSTEEFPYGGSGAYTPCVRSRWRIPGEAALLLAAEVDEAKH